MVAMLLAAVGFVWGQLMMLESKGCCKEWRNKTSRHGLGMPWLEKVLWCVCFPLY